MVCNTLQNLGIYEITRCYKPCGFGKVKEFWIHYFSDASEEGYGQVSFIRMVNCVGAIHCNFILGKARVTSRKYISIPRLELVVAMLSRKMAKFLRKELNIDCLKETVWSDSSVVLGYGIAQLTGTKYNWKSFTVDFGTGAVGVGIAGKLEKLNRLGKLRKLAKDWGLNKHPAKGGPKYEYWTDATKRSHKEIVIKPPGSAQGLHKGSRIWRASVRENRRVFTNPFSGEIAISRKSGVQHIPLDPLEHWSWRAKGQAVAIGAGVRGWRSLAQQEGNMAYREVPKLRY